MPSKPRVTTNCVADNYADPGEKIIEYSFADGSSAIPGGLIAFRWLPHENGGQGELLVNLYRHSPRVRIVVSPGDDV